jgi:hypothetical protein
VDPGLPPPPDPGRGNGRGRGNNGDDFEALIVVGNADNPAAGDDDLVDTIEDLLNGDDEIDTDVADDEDDADDVEEDFDAVLISSSSDDAVLDDEYRNVEIMVVVMDDETQPNMDMTEDQVNQDFGVQNDNEIEIEDENDEIAEAANLEEDDNIEIAANNVQMAFGNPDNDAEIIATRQGQNDEAVLYTYDSGDEMANEREADGDRMFFFLQEQNVNDLNGDGDDLLEAVLLFAITGDAEGP